MKTSFIHTLPPEAEIGLHAKVDMAEDGSLGEPSGYSIVAYLPGDEGGDVDLVILDGLSKAQVSHLHTVLNNVLGES